MVISMAKKGKRKSNLLLTFFCLFIICSCAVTSFNSYSKIIQKKVEKEKLLNKLDELKTEEKILSDDVEKLKNPEYAARYAREKYLYSKTGEKILKID